FAWPANVLGGLIFGVGMVVASSCITGFFYKLGHGMLAVLIGLVTWSIGDIATYRGPLSPLRELLRENPVEIDGQAATLLNVAGPVVGWALVGLLGVAAILLMWRGARVDRRPIGTGPCWVG
ncbi:MAG: YeeE/YedE family protein, partial [Caldilineaceae bacterium]|nr:YeeE/YedE family protein [Caldilineaceae bacterium]